MYNEKYHSFVVVTKFGFWEAVVRLTDFSSLVKGKEELVYIEYEFRRGVRLAIRFTPSEVSFYRVLPLWIAIERGIGMYVFLSSLAVPKFLQGKMESFCGFQLHRLKKEDIQGRNIPVPVIDYIVNEAGDAISVKE